MSSKITKTLSLPLRSAPLTKSASISRYSGFTRAASSYTTNLRAQEQAELEKDAISRNITRIWRVGDVYAPHDLSAAEARKWRVKKTPNTDAFDALNLNPLSMYKNFSIMSEYMTDMGRIRHRRSTGLRPVNQRKIARAIRRAIALGLMPSVHKHPEYIKRQMEARKLGTGKGFA